MRAPGQEPLLAHVRSVIARLGVDPDQALVTPHHPSGEGRKVAPQVELKLIGKLAVAVRETETPTARSIASMLDGVLADIESADAGVKELAEQHWPRRRLYATADALLATARVALTKAAATLRPEYDALAAAPSGSKGNASSAETLFRRHALRIWKELGGDPKLNRSDTIDFLVAAERWMLGKSKRGAIQKWLVRNDGGHVG